MVVWVLALPPPPLTTYHLLGCSCLTTAPADMQPLTDYWRKLCDSNHAAKMIFLLRSVIVTEIRRRSMIQYKYRFSVQIDVCTCHHHQHDTKQHSDVPIYTYVYSIDVYIYLFVLIII